MGRTTPSEKLSAPVDLNAFVATLPRDVYYHPNHGNGGDALITQGMFDVFEQAGITIRYTARGDDLTGQVVICAGGGNLVPYYDNMSRFIAEAHRQAERLIVLPHTIDGHEELLCRLGANVEICCREQRSYDYVRSLNKRVRLHLMHDMAFSMDVDRVLQHRWSWKGLTKHRLFIKQDLAFRAAWMRHRLRTMASPTAKELHGFRLDTERTDQPIPADNMDLSKYYNMSMRDARLIREVSARIMQTVNRFAVVHTNRLHIGIAGALLGKEVHFYPNRYWKNEAIYAFSLKDRFPNVIWHGA